MLDLLAKLRDLKDLIGADYFVDLKGIVTALLNRQWQTATELLFDLMKKFAIGYAFPKPVTMRTVEAVENENGELEALFVQLESQTVVVTASGEASMTPGEWIAIITLVADFLKAFRDRRKPS